MRVRVGLGWGLRLGLEGLGNSKNKNFDGELIQWIEIKKKELIELIDLDNYYWFQLNILQND